MRLPLNERTLAIDQADPRYPFNGIQGRRHGNLHFAGEQTSVPYGR
jgi:hypothetical protein